MTLTEPSIPQNSPIAAFYLADFQLETPSSSAQLRNRIEPQSSEWAVPKRTMITLLMLIISGVAMAGTQLPVHWGLDMPGTILNAGCAPKQTSLLQCLMPVCRSERLTHLAKAAQKCELRADYATGFFFPLCANEWIPRPG